MPGPEISIVERLDQLIEHAAKLGYLVRYDHFAGNGGGICEFGGNKHLFVDLSLAVDEQFAQVKAALEEETSDKAAFPTRSPKSSSNDHES